MSHSTVVRGKGSYRAVPTYWITNLFPCCTRIDLFKQYVGMDVQEGEIEGYFR
jgi:hypothetical protein